ncbi:hypothetical protein FKX85_05635 [Echinicola soli]|uniref:Uncharacterized protein n=1 Tax=Echinicola soli TaxID=2591634 RepID=A0A514CFD9_9BACT|nr:hypothetical protein [Echinicola soli]QDH78539.1 hypothetical protein FKX85_05635 [Echinicola soli]
MKKLFPLLVAIITPNSFNQTKKDQTTTETVTTMVSARAEGVSSKVLKTGHLMSLRSKATLVKKKKMRPQKHGNRSVLPSLSMQAM